MSPRLAGGWACFAASGVVPPRSVGHRSAKGRIWNGSRRKKALKGAFGGFGVRLYCASCGLSLYRYIYNIIRVCVRASRRRRRTHPYTRAGAPGAVLPPLSVRNFFGGLTDVRHCGIMRGEEGGGDGELWENCGKAKGL